MTYLGNSYILSKHDNLKSNQTTGLEFKQKEILIKRITETLMLLIMVYHEVTYLISFKYFHFSS